jgi:hypothetical protein
LDAAPDATIFIDASGTLPEEFQSRAHRPKSYVARIVFYVINVTAAKSLRHQQLDVFADQLAV